MTGLMLDASVALGDSSKRGSEIVYVLDGDGFHRAIAAAALGHE